MQEKEIQNLTDTKLKYFKNLVRSCLDYHKQYNSTVHRELVRQHSRTLELVNKEMLKRQHPHNS